jgi:rhodanese-related sulfurtransferase
MRERIKIKEIVVILAIGICAGMVFNTFHKNKIPFITPPKAEIYARKNIPTLTMDEARAKFDRGVLFVDARDPEEYAEAHIKGALNLPVRHLDVYYPRAKEQMAEDMEIVVYCASPECNASLYLAEELVGLKYEGIEVMVGGWEEWEKLGWPSEGTGPI